MDSDDASSAVTTPALAFFGHTLDEALALTRTEFYDDDSWCLGGAGICLEEPDVVIELLPPNLSDL